MLLKKCVFQYILLRKDLAKTNKALAVIISWKLFWDFKSFMSKISYSIKRSFPVGISLVNVTKSAVSCGLLLYLLKKFLMKTYFACSLLIWNICIYWIDILDI